MGGFREQPGPLPRRATEFSFLFSYGSSARPASGGSNNAPISTRDKSKKLSESLEVSERQQVRGAEGGDEKQMRRAIGRGALHKGDEGLRDAALAKSGWRKPNRRTTPKRSDTFRTTLNCPNHCPNDERGASCPNECHGWRIAGSERYGEGASASFSFHHAIASSIVFDRGKALDVVEWRVYDDPGNRGLLALYWAGNFARRVSCAVAANLSLN